MDSERSTPPLRNPALAAWTACFGSAERNWLGRNAWNHNVDLSALPEQVVADPRFAAVVPHHVDLAAVVVRQVVCQHWAWAVPTPDILEVVGAFGPLVEVGAGRGYWAALLAERGADVVAYDSHPPDAADVGANAFFDRPGLFFPVGRAEADIARAHPERTLLIVWPPYNHPDSFGTAAYRLNGGRRLIYVGEGDGACCGGDAFWHEIATHWRQEQCVALPQWEGLHDYLYIYQTR